MLFIDINCFKKKLNERAIFNSEKLHQNFFYHLECKDCKKRYIPDFFLKNI